MVRKYIKYVCVIVKIAKYLNVEPIPKKLFKGGTPVEESSILNEFAQFFDEKVKNIVDTTTVKDDIYKMMR